MRFFCRLSGLLILTCLACAAQAEVPWGVLGEVVEDTTFTTYAIDNLLDNRQIRYALSNEITPAEEQAFKDNIQQWPQATLGFITKHKRTRTFKDVTTILQRQLVLRRVALSDHPDIYVTLTREMVKYCDGDASGCFVKRGENPYSLILIDEEYRDDFSPILLHELGHFFGLGDQYPQARTNSHPDYSSDVDEDNGALMQGSYTTDGRLTEDDADGFINLIDLRLAQRNGGRFSARARLGWRSLNPDSQNIYQNGRTITRQPVDGWIYTVGGTDFFVRREYKNGTAQTSWDEHRDAMQLFEIFPDIDTEKRDPKTHLISSIRTSACKRQLGSETEVSFCDSVYERRFTYGTPTVEGSAIPISVQELIDGEEIRSRTLLVSADGTLRGLQGVQLKSPTYVSGSEQLGCEIHLQLEEGTFNPQSFRICSKADAQCVEGVVEEGQRIGLPEKISSKLRLCYIYHTGYLSDFNKNFYRPLFHSDTESLRQRVFNWRRRAI